METLYDVLGVDPGCSQEALKRAYHSSILENHPDKQNCSLNSSEIKSIQFQQVHEAYKILRDVDTRREYNKKLEERRLRSELRISDEIKLDEMVFSEEEELFTFACRCGENYVLTVEDVEEQVDVVPCDGCSLNIRVLYE